MTAVHKMVAKDINALLAPIGENWWSYMSSHPNLEIYYEDGVHKVLLFVREL